MKSRDAAIVVDHRRQGVMAPPPSKGDEQARKKKAPSPPKQTNSSQKQPNSSKQQQQAPQGPAIATGALVAQPQAISTKKTTTPASASITAKKNAGKQQTKATKKEKQNAKHAKDTTTATTATATTPVPVSTSSATVAKQQRTGEQTLDPDNLKSRNHTLFLAPSGSSASSSKLLPSWGRSRKESATHSVTERLHTEILEYAQYTRSTVEDMAVHIELMITNVRTCVQSLWPHSNVETFGSYSTGIWLPSSDVDLVILDVVEVNDVVITVKNLRRLAKALEAQAWVHSLVLLDTAKIPVLKLVSADTRVPIDITFESSSTHSGLIARDLIKRYADELPELYPLAVVFKQLLRERDLNDAYTGGLSSYSIVLMIIHFAQLWRNGEKCFLAASIYASGSLPPAPAALAAEAARLAALDAKVSGSPTKATSDSTAGKGSTPTEVGSPVKAAPLAPTSSYAAIVSRPKSLNRSTSETGGKNSSDSNNGPLESQPVQRFSYAAVAAGIVKVSEDNASRSKKATPAAAPAPPSSYAAAVAAAAGSKSSAAATRSSSATKVSATGGSATGTPSSASVSGNSDTQLDSASVTSSNADTEDSSSSCSSSSAADSDDESSRQQQPPVQRCVCLGEHTMMLLEFFGIIFDYRKNGISIRDGGYIYRLADHGSDIGKPALVIEDPIHPDRNVSASSFAFSKVVAVFEDSFYALKYHRPSKFAPSALSCLLSASGHTSHTTKGAISR